MQALPALLVTDPLFERHKTGPRHPECPERYLSILKSLTSLGVDILSPRDAEEREILSCHTQGYLQILKNDIQECIASGIEDGKYCLSTGDAQICPESYKVAIRAAGAVITGVDAVMKGVAKSVFCLVRPPGHHACSDKGMGFCLLNNIAIGAKYARDASGVKKILIVDWDVHHGNGTQEIFYSDPSVFYFSTHQAGLYPGTGLESETGSGKGRGFTMNCPIEPGPGSRDFVFEAFKERLVPAMEKFKPELVMISAGFDAHVNDPLGSFNLTDDDFRDLTQIVKQIAATYSNGRIVSVLEGGYNLKAIASAAKAHVAALMDH